MPSSKDPAINRQKANEYRLAHPEWHRRKNRQWVSEKRQLNPGFEKEARKRHRANMTDEQKRARAAYMRAWHEAHPNYMRDKQAENHANFPSKRMVEAAKHRAKKLGLPFDLDWREITVPSLCPVLGIPLVSGFVGFNDNGPSLDRLKPELGYVKENVRVISYRANAIKRDATLDELRALVAYVERELS